MGSAVTIPYKENNKIFRIDSNCKKIGSINTILKKGNN